ncbi:component of scar regulatory complex [Planoprotostelium fungivorum]|uniref:Component of scar regulatory complex n=1 Tax=Planoprotostelium fungivorum TaxID=1890364 RepID=A0A2P6N4Z0_9EUKA|nr:component of scar regulatory complex [Planoprotostelium fungivorum]
MPAFSAASSDPSAADMTSHIQKDWEQRELVENVTVNIKKIVEFLNKFDASTRYRLAKINEQLTTLERQMEYVEAALKGASE